MQSIFCLRLAKQSETCVFVGFYVCMHVYEFFFLMVTTPLILLCFNFALRIFLSWPPIVWAKPQSRTLVSLCGQRAGRASGRKQLTWFFTAGEHRISRKGFLSPGFMSSELSSGFSPWIHSLLSVLCRQAPALDLVVVLYLSSECSLWVRLLLPTIHLQPHFLSAPQLEVSVTCQCISWANRSSSPLLFQDRWSAQVRVEKELAG